MKVIVICQYKENYSDTSIPSWKNKGSHEFVIDMSGLITPDTFINASNIIEPMIKEVVKKECNDRCIYDVVSIVPQFSEPTDITEKFKKEFYSID